MHISMLSLCVYYDLYGLNKLCPPDTYVDIFP